MKKIAKEIMCIPSHNVRKRTRKKQEEHYRSKKEEGWPHQGELHKKTKILSNEEKYWSQINFVKTYRETKLASLPTQ